MANQKWDIVDNNKRSYNLKTSEIDVGSGIRFQIKTKGSSGRVVYYSDYLGYGGGQYRLRIRTPNGGGEEWWVYHPETRTIRLYVSQGWTISNEYDYELLQGKMAVMRQYRATDQAIYYDGAGRFHNGRDEGLCMDVWGGSDSENQPITFWPCHSGWNQAWKLRYFP